MLLPNITFITLTRSHYLLKVQMKCFFIAEFEGAAKNREDRR